VGRGQASREEARVLVAQILKTKGAHVYTCTPEALLGTAAAMLTQRGVGAMVVLDGERVVGIVSERDVVRAVATDGGEALERPVRQYMTSDVVYAKLSESVDELMERMTDRRFRHLPVCEEGKLVGIVSIGDLVKTKIAETVHEAEELIAYIAGSEKSVGAS
jgi:CBS domain-containing protein